MNDSETNVYGIQYHSKLNGNKMINEKSDASSLASPLPVTKGCN